MNLNLKNIGIIKEANIKLNGITLIAGENDTGKSTVSKALFFKIKFLYGYIKELKDFDKSKEMSLEKKIRVQELMSLPQNIFKNRITTNGYIGLNVENREFGINIKNDKNSPTDSYNDVAKLKSSLLTPIMIETPMIWDLLETFKNISLIKQQMGIGVQHPYIMGDLAIKLSNKNIKLGGEFRKDEEGEYYFDKQSSINIREKIISIIGGEFKKDEVGEFYFEKKGKRVELINTAMGIKYFGILQILSENDWLIEKNSFLIFDEPEIHLHPKWQLKLVKILIELVKNGIKILITSHSPYMIEAIKRYSELEGIEDKTDFYLVENGYIEEQESLENIFEKLAIPMRELKKLKLEKYLND